MSIAETLASLSTQITENATSIKTALDGKSNVGHSHAIADTTGLQASLDSKETPAGAQSKATTAETNAKTYADTVSATAETNANTYTDGEVSALTAVVATKETPAGAQSKATTAENNARAYADSVANAAETAANTYTDNAVSAAVADRVYKEAVANFTAIATTYPSPEEGWTVSVDDTNQVYRYDADSATWIAISSGAIPLATQSNSGLMSSADKTKLDGVEGGANNYALPVASSTLGGVKNGGAVAVAGDGTMTVQANTVTSAISNVTGLQAALDSKASTSSVSSSANAALANAKSYADQQDTLLADTLISAFSNATSIINGA